MASPPRIERGSFSIDKKKFGSCTGGTIAISKAAEDVFTDEGWSGSTDPPPSVKVTLKSIVFVGRDGPVLLAMLQDKYIEGKIRFLGKQVVCQLKITEISGDWDNKGRTFTGNITMTGGQIALS